MDKKAYKLIKHDKKKYMIITPTGKKIGFGAVGYEDYTMHKDEERKQRYVARHKKHEDWHNKNTAGFWSKNLLWNKPTLKESIEDTEKKFNIKIHRA